MLLNFKNSREKEFSRLLEQALGPAILFNLPQSFIDIYVTVLEADGIASSLALAITCASMALIDAGVEMYDIVVGSAIVVLNLKFNIRDILTRMFM